MIVAQFPLAALRLRIRLVGGELPCGEDNAGGNGVGNDKNEKVACMRTTPMTEYGFLTCAVTEIFPMCSTNS